MTPELNQVNVRNVRTHYFLTNTEYPNDTYL